MPSQPTMEWDDSEIVKALAKAGTKGLTTADLTKRLPAGLAKKSVLTELKASGLIRGPFRIGRSYFYFDAKNAPTREQMESRIEELLRHAGIKVTSRSSLETRIKGVPKSLFKDALSLLKAEGKIVELKGPTGGTLYVHREPVLDQLRLSGGIGAENKHRTPPPASPKTSISLEEVRPVYEALKAQQGGISAVKIYDILKAFGGSKDELHRLLLNEARHGRVSLHPASTVNFSREVMEAGIRLDGQPHPFVTVVLKEGP
jgi:hypothetical protein